ncbi:MAG TPA: GNAT family N-acetyltransferase [Myxococcota bacterium]|nr:GNAT family N-acetyltransferase [Myxococcota bacterium]
MSAWSEAGGDEARLALYAQLGQVEGLAIDDGRILASINPSHAPTGALGDLVGGTSQIQAGESWLRERGCLAVQAPLELATWFPYRANLGPHDDAPFWGEPQGPPEPWREAGYREVARYASALAENSAATAYGQAKRPRGVHIHQMGDFEESLESIWRLATSSFEEAYAYSPLPQEAMAALYRPLRDHVVPELVLFAEVDREPAGFVFGIPDLAAPGSGRFIVKTLAVAPAHRRSGMGAWLVGELHRAASKLGFTHGIHALMWAGSRSRNISAHGGRVFREYALYMKAL